MGRSKRGAKNMVKVAPTYGSDDERAYEGMEAPDTRDSSYYHDDIDDFHADKEKMLLDKGAALRGAESSEEEVEVLPIEDDEDDSDENELRQRLTQFRAQHRKVQLDSDEEEDEDADLPDVKAWGSKKRHFYGADVDEDASDFSGSEEGDADLEEHEALAIQKRLAEQLDDRDFDLDLFKPTETESKEEEKDETVEEEKIEKDLSKLSKREKLELLKKESPELLEMISEYKIKLSEIKEKYNPLMNLVKKGVIPPGKGADFISTKLNLNLNYCVNISFYMMLKSKALPVHNHPVIGRLVQYRNLLKQLEPLTEQLAPEIDLIVEKLNRGEDLPVVSQSTDDAVKPGQIKQRSQNGEKRIKKQKKTLDMKRKISDLLDDDSDVDDDVRPEGGRTWGRKSKMPKDDRYETKDERAALEYYDMMKAGRKQPENVADERDEEDREVDEGQIEDNEEGEEDGSGKRGINYQIEKNRGLTPHRKKENKNPRVKHRMKYRKAKIRRRGMIRDTRTEMHKYGGEVSGIRAGIKRSVKLKA